MKSFFYSLAASGLLLATNVAQAAQKFEAIPDPSRTILKKGPTGVIVLIETITNWLFVFLLVLAVLFIILAAYKYMFSEGGEEGVSAAHKMLIYAVVAIAVAFLAKGIVFVVRQLVTTGGSSGGSSGSIDYQNGSVDVNINF